MQNTLHFMHFVTFCNLTYHLQCYDFQPTHEMPELLGQGMAVRFSIGSQASSPINKATTALNMKFQFEIRNNKHYQPQGMAANGIRTYAAPTSDVHWI